MLETEAPLAGKRCLVLDDEYLIALDIQHILESAGAESVVCVSNADAAMAALQSGTEFDFAVLDFKLIGTKGDSLSVAQWLTNQRIPFIFLTGMRADDAHLKKFPNVAVVEKPYQAPMLLETVRRALAAE